MQKLELLKLDVQNVVPILVSKVKDDRLNTDFLDLKVIYNIPVPSLSQEDITATYPVKLDLFQSTSSEIIEKAFENIENDFDIISLQSIIFEMVDDARSSDEENYPEQIILTNKERINGAIQMMNKKALQEIEKYLGKSFFILPSSIHEVICLSGQNDDVKRYKNIVKSINEQVVDEKDFLSNNVYMYNGGKITIA